MTSTSGRPPITDTSTSFESPEAQLLLHASRRDIDAGRRAAIASLIAAGIDWERAAAMAERHHVAPLLHRALLAVGVEGLPAAPLARIAARARNARLCSLYLTTELRVLLRELAGLGVPAIPFKGPVLSEQIYGDSALREYGDIDILVPRERVLDVKRLLLARGFEAERRLTGWKEALHLAVHCEVNFRRPGGLPVEIHWRFFPIHVRFPLRIADVWARAAPVVFDGSSVPGLAPDDLLLLLCAHDGGKHGWRYLRWISDVADLIRSHGARIDWDTLRARAAACGCRRLFAVGMLLARGVLDAPVPDGTYREVARDRAALRIARGVCWMLFNGTLEDEHGLRKSLLYLGLRERLRDRIAYGPTVLAKLLKPTARDRDLVRLPAVLAALYLPVRAARLALKYSAMALKRAGRETHAPAPASEREPG